ncbi:MAG: aconitase X swivel domain-containing protein [Candidatus Jordarchaeum sp.]|uniref:aconitase X swivel domain-containing protein n=1 Tax=Candidatus Jordarchaeum sp. TaxID=2823881 RepID=UPI00404A741B
MKLTLKGEGLRGLKNHRVEGEALVTKMPISFLGFIDPKTGKVIQKGHELEGKSVKGKILVFSTGIGSTVGSYVLINLANKGLAPKAIIQKDSDIVTLVGAVIGEIPLVHRLDQDPLTVIKNGDKLTVDSEKGIVEVEKREE